LPKFAITKNTGCCLEVWIGTKVPRYHGKFGSTNNAQNGGREHDEFFASRPVELPWVMWQILLFWLVA